MRKKHSRTKVSSNRILQKHISVFTPERLRALLGLEKKNRGVADDKLVFVGMANLAGYYWCAIHSVLASRNQELMFFSAYLQDRLKYSIDLGLINDLPTSDTDLLRVGDEIKFRDLGKFLIRSPKSSGAKVDINVVVDAKSDPFLRGNFMHLHKAKKYNTLRWNFPANNYVVVGIPDGITKEFVYEYKTTSQKFLVPYVKPCAFAQADLYGHFFERKNKRVQVYVVKDGATQTWEEPIESKKVVSLLANFAEVDEGKLFPHPPKEWKCRKCDVCQFGKLCKAAGRVPAK